MQIGDQKEDKTERECRVCCYLLALEHLGHKSSASLGFPAVIALSVEVWSHCDKRTARNMQIQKLNIFVNQELGFFLFKLFYFFQCYILRGKSCLTDTVSGKLEQIKRQVNKMNCKEINVAALTMMRGGRGGLSCICLQRSYKSFLKMLLSIIL